jgi:hypothetical protein
MVDYTVEDWAGTKAASVGAAVAELEVKLETIANTKTIRLIGIAVLGQGKFFQPYLIYDT